MSQTKRLNKASLLCFALLCAALCASYPQAGSAGVASGSGSGSRTALEIKTDALKEESVLDVIDYLRANISSAATDADTRSLLYFTGMLQEQVGLYTDASLSYARAAGIAAHDAAGMDRATSEELVLDAVRASLSSGDWERAASYLNTAVRSSKNEEILARVNLYSVWCDLCRAASGTEENADIADSVAMLKAYCDMSSMKSVRSEVLLTLYHLTEDSSYADEIKKDYPGSPEAAVVEGNAHIMRSPFWYFVPRLTESEETAPVAAGDEERDAEPASSPAETGESQSGAEIEAEEKRSGRKQQLGLFRERANAEEYVRRVREAGFDAYFYTETRESGTTYFIVVVDDPEGTMGERLRARGFDCYTVE